MSQNYYMYNGHLYSADELKHWKYISKKKVNGKWRYVYKDTDGKEERYNYINNMKKKYEYASKKERALAEKMSQGKDRTLDKQWERTKYGLQTAWYGTGWSLYKSGYAQAKTSYYLTLPVRAVEKTIAKAYNWVANLFDKNKKSTPSKKVYEAQKRRHR